MNINKLNLLVSSTLLMSTSFSVLATVEALDSQSPTYIYPQPQPLLESREQLETQIKVGVTEMLGEPTWEMRLAGLVENALEAQAHDEKEKKEIIALIVEELNTNGPSKQENIALNTLPKAELKSTLDSIVKNASVDLNQQVSDYRKTIQTTASAQQEEPAKTVLAKNKPQKRSKQLKGWIYVGQFFNKNWSEKLLNVDTGLPKKGKDYLLKFSANMRDSLPSKQLGMSNVITSLTSGDKIKVLNIHPSGSKGHYWALVESLK